MKNRLNINIMYMMLALCLLYHRFYTVEHQKVLDLRFIIERKN